MGIKGRGLINDPAVVTISVRFSKPDYVMLEKLSSMTRRSKVGMIKFLIQEEFIKELEIKSEKVTNSKST